VKKCSFVALGLLGLTFLDWAKEGGTRQYGIATFKNLIYTLVIFVFHAFFVVCWFYFCPNITHYLLNKNISKAHIK